ncbi:MAPEG family protein, partial [Phenylobacterium sp.]|uniref:MAPEG family protein n=1 Tax=Phenylobacterium sp. TaxID=1871053 RepID=UPI0030F38C49
MVLAPVTSALAAASALALVGLSVPVSVRRFKARVLLGDGRDKVLLARIRAQANFVEYVPAALIVLGLAEVNGASAWLVWTCAMSLVLGRAAHAFGMLTGAATKPRAVG